MPKNTRKDWWLGLILGLGLTLIAQTHWLQPLERAHYHSTMGLLNFAPQADIVLLEIEADQWPALSGEVLPRSLFTQALQRLHSAQPKLIANTVFFNRLQYGELAQQTRKAVEFYDSSRLVNTAHTGVLQQEVFELGQYLHQIQRTANPEEALAQALTQAQVVQAIPFAAHLYGNNATQHSLLGLDWLPQNVLRQRLLRHQIYTKFSAAPAPPSQAALIIPPIAPLQENSITLSLQTSNPPDKALEPLVVQFQEYYFPTLPLQLATQALGLKHSDIQVSLGHGVQLGEHSINTDATLQLRPFYYQTPFPRVRFQELLQDSFDLSLLTDKIVLIGLANSALNDQGSSDVQRLAHSLSSLLQDHYLNRPEAVTWLEWGLFGLILLYLSLLLPRLNVWAGALSSLFLLLGLSILPWAAMQYWHWWLSTLLPLLLLISGYAVWWLSRLWLNWLRQAQMSAEGIEANRLLGLAYQGQGRLELAFEKFSLCPLNDDMLGLLYNLALDFERKHHTKEALAVYRYMADGTPDYRDIEQRLQRLQQQKKRLPQKGRYDLSHWLEENSELRKPMLGRYQVEKKLGKGAMGVVYLGKDAKMDRMVALKTLLLSEEFEGEQLEDATQRFFREASAAGRLTHEHIVAVYDAGEEDNLAYIAMEFFKGSNLMPYTRKDNLLPIDTVFDIAIHAAEALQYAHTQNVVHRDIKPGNMMFNPGNGQLKLTDFGIARITDTSKTKTGVILGTPSYMSPEQLAGKLADGRSDLFSLGVTLYQLFTGCLPFQADSMASLMFQISHDPHPLLLDKRTDLPPCLPTVLDILLHKDPDQRYADGAATAQALRECRDTWIQSQYQPLPSPFIDPPADI